MIKHLVTGLLLLQILSAQVIIRKPVPAEVKEEAAAAVKVLAQEVLKQNFSYSFEKMYPKLKESSAKKVGSMEKLKMRFNDIPKQMQAQGINIIDLSVNKPGKAFEVNAAHFTDSSKQPVFTEYLVFVPTTTIYRAIDTSTGAIKKVQIESFQVAVRSIEGGEWSFIDGSELSISELRSLFPNLPKDSNELSMPGKSVLEL